MGQNELKGQYRNFRSSYSDPKSKGRKKKPAHTTAQQQVIRTSLNKHGSGRKAQCRRGRCRQADGNEKAEI